LRILGCPNNKLTNLDVSRNTKLTHLFCSGNQLKSLDVSKNTKLTVLDCRSNQLSVLDVSKNTDLDYLNCGINQLSNLNIGNNSNLRVLFCEKNSLKNFDTVKSISLLLWLIVNENLFYTDELNALFRTLPLGNRNIICIEKNPGADDCDINTVESKGWEVVDYNISLTESENETIKMITDEYCC